jgi:multidrug transporter EmrE-like cation transporter
MFIYLIFKKFGWKQSKFRMAFAYSLFYILLSFIVLGLSTLYLKMFSLEKTIIYSLLVGITMYMVYLVKWYIFKMSLKG